MTPIAFIFWILVLLVAYTYFGYAFLLYMVRPFGRRSALPVDSRPKPSVAMIIAACDEAEIIAAKIANTKALDYPSSLLRIIVVTDGSSDGTDEIVSSLPDIVHLHAAERKGKVNAMNRGIVEAADADLLVFSDANAFLNPQALQCMVRHFDDPAVGGVSGEKRVEAPQGAVLQGESFYWRYESAMKKLDAAFHSVVGAAGELFAVRRAICPKVPDHIILDDLYITLTVCRQGYRFAYEPEAYAIEQASLSLREERERKIRISAGAFQILRMFGPLLDPFRNGKLSFQYLSRRVFRWVICPLSLPLILLLNGILVLQHASPEWLYRTLLMLQTIAYLLACIGAYQSQRRLVINRIFLIPYYFVFMHALVWYGFLRFLLGRQSVRWQKAGRQRLP